MQTQKTELLERILSCPVCNSSTRYVQGSFHCNSCNSVYPYYDQSILEILPPEPLSFSTDERSPYHEAIYHHLFRTGIGEADPGKSWARPELVPEGWRNVKYRHVDFIYKLIGEATGKRHIYCDFTGSSGYYTFEMSKHFDWVLHCDLSMDSLLYAQQKAAEQNIHNILFIRADYFRPPFNHVLDLVYCGDTLIYSPSHEHLLLAGMYQALKSGGVAVFDLHNWWHNPIRRLGLLPNNNGKCYSYNRFKADAMVRKHFPRFRRTGYYQEFPSGKLPGWIPRLFPNTRHTYIARKEANVASIDAVAAAREGQLDSSAPAMKSARRR
ncbi:MAG TPA: methyltransferase domain-containing protein [Lacibacter sp.]|nr:methyltransferase domain-containing protein [Lacibacter sp.]